MEPTPSTPPVFERPQLGTMTDYSSSHCATLCACEIDNALARSVITKIGHYSAIIEAHFPNAQDVYRAARYALEKLEEQAEQLKDVRRDRHRDALATLRYVAEQLRKALPVDPEAA